MAKNPVFEPGGPRGYGYENTNEPAYEELIVSVQLNKVSAKRI